MLYLRAPALTLDASEVLQSLVQITQPRATVRPGHFDSRPSDPVASSASFLRHCSAASATATSCFGASRAHEYFITGGTKVRRYKGGINQEFRPSTYLLT